eukprot:TRINITY_DN5143_c0_g1_i1.p1 TRINITY_DN5143_c0_g1~~TRINITY_DN5143_c0_g1_i1.p1  ORF type:complete len:240 (+),score=50.31 TRINITY_DN5143_c0_g1_i1:105-722(+)
MGGEEVDFTAKVVLIGDPSTGKSAIFCRYLGRPVEDSYKATIGVDFGHKIVPVGDKKVRLQLWDTAGQERFRSLTQSYYRGAHAMIFVFDVSNLSSFEHIKKWMTEASDAVSTPNAFRLLLGNKIDLEVRAVDENVIREYAESVNVRYLQVSAKEGRNIDQVFDIVAASLPSLELKSEKIPSFKPSDITESIPAGSQPEKSSCKC